MLLSPLADHMVLADELGTIFSMLVLQTVLWALKTLKNMYDKVYQQNTMIITVTVIVINELRTRQIKCYPDQR